MAQAILDLFPDGISQYGLYGCGIAVAGVLALALLTISLIAIVDAVLTERRCRHYQTNQR